MEEAPSPALDDRLRKKMATAAVALAKAARYQNLGTVEFLLDRQKRFYFYGDEYSYSGGTSGYRGDYWI